MDWNGISEWFLSLGEQYGLEGHHLIIFGIIYVGAIPLFTVSLGWLIRNLRQKTSPLVPALFTGFFFISAYLYLIFIDLFTEGPEIPAWVYVFIAVLVGAGVFSTLKKIRTGVAEEE